MKLDISFSLSPKDREPVTPAETPDPTTLEFRKRVQDVIEKMELEFDKALLALHPLAITFSAALYNQLIAAKIPIINGWLVFSAWGAWLAGIIFTLFSFRTSVWSNRRNLDRFDEGTLNTSNYRDAWVDHATSILTWGSMLFFVIGVILAASFLASRKNTVTK